MPNSLQHDVRGFLIGERLVNGIDLVKKDSGEILKILKASLDLQHSNTNRLRVTLDRLGGFAHRRTPDPVLMPRIDNSRPPVPTIDVGAPSGNSPPLPPTIDLAPNSPRPSKGQPSPVPSSDLPALDSRPSPDGRVNNGRRRNSQGQFEGDGQSEDEKKKNDGIKKAIHVGLSINADTHNIDPTVDAVRELGTLMSPLAKVGKSMFKGATWLFRRKKKQEPPSDKEQRQQSRIEKLLKRIAGSRVGQAAGSGMNLFGGLIGGAGDILSTLGKALIPALGLTSAFSLGKFVGGKIYDYIEPELTPLIDGIAAIPDKISQTWQDVIDIASRGIEAVVNEVRGVKNKATGAYDSAVDFTSHGIENVADLFKGKPKSSFTTDKAAAIKATADRLGVNPNDLAQIISFESAGSFDPAKKNGKGRGATGLIQFMPDTAKSIGATTDDLAKMSFEQQMAYVEKYFVGRGIGKNGKTSLADMYNAVQGVPASGYRVGTQAYAQNKAWDVNGDGVIMPDEAVQGLRLMLKTTFPALTFQKLQLHYLPCQRLIQWSMRR